jgi:hypothetical protein
MTRINITVILIILLLLLSVARGHIINSIMREGPEHNPSPGHHSPNAPKQAEQAFETDRPTDHAGIDKHPNPSL